MSSTPVSTSKRRTNLFRTLALSLGAFAIVGITDIATILPANAWYDTYGYWHPNRHYYRHYWHSSYRHHWWCERHPYACGYHRY